MSGKCFERVVLLLLGVGLLGGGLALLRARQLEARAVERSEKVDLEHGVDAYEERMEETRLLLQTGQLKVSSK